MSCIEHIQEIDVSFADFSLFTLQSLITSQSLRLILRFFVKLLKSNVCTRPFALKKGQISIFSEQTNDLHAYSYSNLLSDFGYYVDVLKERKEVQKKDRCVQGL